MKHRALLFDLDGVLTDTARYHFLAWKELADSLRIDFTEKDNERLKGVSRMRSFEIILEIGHMEMSESEKSACCEKKNQIYRSFILNMQRDETLPGVRGFLADCRQSGYLVALGSASKNAPDILKRLEITDYFDAIIDGNQISKAKPDPQVYLKAAEALMASPEECLVFEDAQAGIEAAHAAGMSAVGVGENSRLAKADLQIAGFEGITIFDVEGRLQNGNEL